MYFWTVLRCVAHVTRVLCSCFEEHRDVGSRVLLDDCDCGHLKGTVVQGCMRGPSELATLRLFAGCIDQWSALTGSFASAVIRYSNFAVNQFLMADNPLMKPERTPKNHSDGQRQRVSMHDCNTSTARLRSALDNLHS